MTNPKQTSGQSSADARSITEQDISRRVAEALGWKFDEEIGCWRDTEGKTQYCSFSFPCDRFHPLANQEQLCRLLMDNLEGVCEELDFWFWQREGGENGKVTQWWENQEFLANKELWILRAIVAYKEDEE